MYVFMKPEYIEETQTGKHANSTKEGVQTRKCELKTISNL